MVNIVIGKEVKAGTGYYEFRGAAEDVANMADTPLSATNFFSSDMAKNGFVYLLKKCGNYHLMIPPQIEGQIDEILTGKFAHVVVGTNMTTIIFDDLSDTPMSLNFDNQQILGMFEDIQDKPRRKGFLAVYKLGQTQPDKFADKVTEVGRMDLWISRTLGTVISLSTGTFKARQLTKTELTQYN